MLLQTIFAVVLATTPVVKHYDYVICKIDDGQLWQMDGDVILEGNTVIITANGRTVIIVGYECSTSDKQTHIPKELKHEKK